jgi:hypothetical protein
MCCDTTACGAQSETCRFAFGASVTGQHIVNTTSRFGKMGWYGVMRWSH